MSTKRPVASISLDADNLWSYLKTHGDVQWERRPSYLPVLTERLLDVWGAHSIRGTVFVVGFDAARDDGADLVARAHAAGHEVANHSFEHEPWLHLYSHDQLEDDLARTERSIIAAGAPSPRGFRGPGYSLSPELLDILAQRGYAYDATSLPTWIGPLARAYYLRSTPMSAQDREQRGGLFGSARDGLGPNSPFRWSTGAEGLVELPVTVFPGLRVPFHVSYVLHLYSLSPAIARTYLRTALTTCRLLGRGPSILLHPLDLLDATEAPGLEFFPGMGLEAKEKRRVVDYLLALLSAAFDVRPTGEHARLAGSTATSWRDPAGAGPRRKLGRMDRAGD